MSCTSNVFHNYKDNLLHSSNYVPVYWKIDITYRRKEWFPMMRFWLRRFTHVNLNHLNKIEARSKLLSLKRSWARFNFYAYERPFKYCLNFICQRKFYARTHVKITRHWKSTLTECSTKKWTKVPSCGLSSSPNVSGLALHQWSSRNSNHKTELLSIIFVEYSLTF